MIISTISEKGGVGKTTVSVNTARGIAALGKKVLVIDLDQQCNASKAFGFAPDGKPTSSEMIYNAVADIKTDYSETVRHSKSGVDYIPASRLLTGITSFIANDSDSNYVLKKIISNDFFKKYDYIIFDCRTLLDLLAANAMNASNRIIIPVECGLYSYMGLHGLIDKIISINNSTNRNLKLLGILMNKQQRTSVAGEIMNEIKKQYGKFLFETVIPFCPAQAEQSVLTDKFQADRSSLNRAFLNVAEEVIRRTTGDNS